jgi:hypothetical protein
MHSQLTAHLRCEVQFIGSSLSWQSVASTVAASMTIAMSRDPVMAVGGIWVWCSKTCEISPEHDGPKKTQVLVPF